MTNVEGVLDKDKKTYLDEILQSEVLKMVKR